MMNTMILKMMSIKNSLSIAVIGGVLALVFFVWFPMKRIPETGAPVVSREVSERPSESPKVAPPQEAPVEQSLPKRALLRVPFTVQAPFAEWADPIFQDACEEASVTIAAAWVFERPLTKESAKKDIAALAKYQKGIYGHSVDTSIDDTMKLLTDFFKVTTVTVEREVTIQDIKEALAAGKIVIVPTDGRKLGNPNFKQPGPPRHMLVVVGYDDATREFIVNDPGTRKGEGYRYDQAVLYDAILDYPTGKHAEATSLDKVMLVVSRKE